MTTSTRKRKVSAKKAAAGEQPSAAFMRSDHSPFFFSWRPALRDERDDVLAGYVMAAARVIDTMHNSGWIAGAVEQAVSSTLGTGLRLTAKPDVVDLGWTQDMSNEWARNVERRWEAWSSAPLECDAAGVMNVAQMTAAVLKSFFGYGESVALLPSIRRPVSQTRTKVRLIPAHRMVQETNPLIGMVQGVRADVNGLPVAYRFQFKDPRLGYENLVDVAARDAALRPQVVHVFEGAPGQVRGISPMTPALRVIRQFDQLADATLEAALIHAIFAATVVSDAPTEDVLRALQDDAEQGIGGLAGGSMADWLGAKAGWYENTKIDFGRAGRIAHLFPGEKLELHKSQSPNATYEAFAKFLLREIARALGMTFETLTGDYTGATYSSVRMATSEIWPIILRRRANICARFLQFVYEAWLEEEIEFGRIPFPGGLYGFLAKRPAAARADWRGPPKPQADDLKTAKAHETYYRLGLSTAEMICSDLGHDWEDVYEQRAREAEARKRLKLDDDPTITPGKKDPVADKLAVQEDKVDG
ncbi:phage portal protein [Rhodoplanes sp. TEM]|uniref:Phage portal protein n=1 Tax=Rhodoplanes tepidamans TaxID=200616 RepID=A0ABT5J5R4_RHOTP|nr:MULTISPECIES: phage portal protein [Rhodoplanes]MDC7784777.1 phage portal protein [Rhodoplanes tepidamans]MDC7982244.1 phage portal protein [Rhodoplanes sp. TEM]MDQ0356251.1 lambda family phage portal protein [Rhodoplanes tepidamans]